jgi:prepilin-type N-terminal cleavage/methylation domain-containing protein
LSQKRNQHGFTLFELLMVLMITVILCVLALPSFLTFFREYRATATGQTLLYNLQYARGEAIKRNANVYVTFSTTDPWCYGINVGSACACTTANSCSLGTFNAAKAQDFTLSGTGLTSNSLIFEGTRGATTNGKTIITFTVYGQTPAMSVEVTAIGNMLMCSANISGYPTCP